ncbi:MAG: response regulator [Nitrospiria bacterium]
MDDHESGRYALTRLLTSEGFSVLEAATGGEALTLMSEALDLVILDVHLPDMSGLEVCRRIKSNPDTASLPVLHLSATYVQSEDRARGLAGGADAYLTEPVEAPELIATIHALLRVRQAEEKARTIAYEWQATFDAINDGIAILDLDGRIVRGNRALTHLVHQPDASLIGRPHHEVLPVEGPDSAFTHMLRTGCRETFDVTRGGRWFRSTSDPLVNARGAVTGAIYLLSDITQHKHDEEEILRTGKLEALGVLAGGIAHDFNNTLTAIVGHISLAKLALDPSSKIAARLKEAAAVCLKARNLTQQLLTFAKGGTPVKKGVAIKEWLESQAQVVGASSAPCRVHVPSELWPVIADEEQLRQVIAQVLANAHEAMPDGGVITLTAETVILRAQASPSLKDGRYVKVTIKDQGVGISPEQLSRIFDPFFSTKSRHNGLGLTTAYSIMKKHEGQITVESEPGIGSVFSLYFPAAREAMTPSEPPTASQAGQKILFMDDDRSIREAFGELLIAEGYQVECVPDGDEAVAAYRRAEAEGRRFDAVILDLTVAGGAMGGMEAIRQIRELDPGVKAIVSSGYSNDPVMADCRAYGFSDVLNKPYQIDDLTGMLAALLGSRPASS